MFPLLSCMTELAVKEQFVELRGSGLSFASIAEKLNVSKTTLVKWSKDFEADIHNLREIHAESLRERFRVNSERRISIFVKHLDAIEAELATRTGQYSVFKTEQLFDLATRLIRELAVTDAPLKLNKYEDITESIVGGIGTSLSWEA